LPAVKVPVIICVSFLLESENKTPQLPRRGVTAWSDTLTWDRSCQGPFWNREGKGPSAVG
jgi:hypothetical protein